MELLEKKQITNVALENPIGLSGLFATSFPYLNCGVAMAQADNKHSFAATLMVSWCSQNVVRVEPKHNENIFTPTLTKSHLVSWEYAFLRSGLHVLRPRLGVRRCEHSTGLIEKPLIAHASRHQIFFHLPSSGNRG